MLQWKYFILMVEKSHKFRVHFFVQSIFRLPQFYFNFFFSQKNADCGQKRNFIWTSHAGKWLKSAVFMDIGINFEEIET